MIATQRAFVGPLGGLQGEHSCAHCNAPLFLNETRTKCCVGALGSGAAATAEWYGPFCSYPYIPQPEGEYRALWYGTDERSKHFLANTRLYNCRYACMRPWLEPVCMHSWPSVCPCGR